MNDNNSTSNSNKPVVPVTPDGKRSEFLRLVRQVIALRKKQDADLKALLMWGELKVQLDELKIGLNEVEGFASHATTPHWYNCVRLKDGRAIPLYPFIQAAECRSLDELDEVAELDEPNSNLGGDDAAK